MGKEEIFKIATDFSKTPGPRFIKEGDFSAELLLNSKLIVLFQKIVDENSLLIVDLDDTAGYATSFLEGTFGGLARKFSPDIVLKHLKIKSDKKKFYKDEVLEYINDVSLE